SQQRGTNRQSRPQADQRYQHEREPQRRGQPARTSIQIPCGLDGDVMSAMHGEGDKRHQACDHGVPIEHAGSRPDVPVGPKRQEEVTVLLERYPANHVAESGSVENGEQQAGESEAAVEEAAPNWRFEMQAELDADPTQDEQPQYNHQRQIESAEPRSVEKRKSKVERSAAGQQPDFVAVPNRTDGADDRAPFPVGLGDEQV